MLLSIIFLFLACAGVDIFPFWDKCFSGIMFVLIVVRRWVLLIFKCKN